MAGVEAVKNIDDLLKRSDIVSLHVPEAAKGLVNKEFLNKMKDNALLVNTSRGSVVVDKDLIDHLKAKKNFWYAADVFNGEP